MKTIKYDFPTVGCYVDESAGSADDCNRRTIEFAQDYGFTVDNEEYEELVEEENKSEWLSETADEALDFLNDLETRSFMSWQFEDNSLFLMADVDRAKEDVGFVSSKQQDYPPDDYQGEWLHVSDHGNATLYVREGGKDEEIWGVV